MKYTYSTGLTGIRAVVPILDGITVNLKGAIGNVTIDEIEETATAEVTAPSRVVAIDEGNPNGAGWFTRDLSSLLVGPSSIAPPILDGVLPGDTLGMTAGAWMGAEAPANLIITFTLEVDRGTGFAPVFGYDNKSYGSVLPFILTEADRGARFRLVETAFGATTGVSTATSGIIDVPLVQDGFEPGLVGSPINQDTDLSADGIAVETAANAFPAAGRYLVAVADLTSGGQADLAIEGAQVTTSTALGQTTGTGNAHVLLFLTDVAAAGNLVVRNTSTVDSLARQILIFDADGLSEQDVLFASATGATGDDPLSIGFSNVASGSAALAIGVCRAGSSTDAVWSGAFSPSNEVSDASLSSATHRVAAATGAVPAGNAQITVAFDDNGGPNIAFAMAAILFASTSSVPVSGAHPGFLKSAGDAGLTLVNGWGEGDHYTLEVDPAIPERFIYEPGETTEIWYFDSTANGGLTRADIDTASGTSSNDGQRYNWLRSTTNRAGTQYGLRSDRPLSSDEIFGFFNQFMVRNENNARSPWFSIADGAEISSIWRGKGESALHPMCIGTMLSPGGSGAVLAGVSTDPAFRRRGIRVGNADSLRNMAFVGLRLPKERGVQMAFAAVNDDTNFIFNDMDISGQATVIDTAAAAAVDRITLYANNTADVSRLVPDNGSEWNNERCSGLHTNSSTGILGWANFFDANGFDLYGYDPDDSTFAGGSGHPNNIFNHNMYDDGFCRDRTELMTVTCRGSSLGMQARGGIYGNLHVFCDNNATGNISNGETNFRDYTVVAGPGFDIGPTENDDGETIIGQTSGAEAVAFKFIGTLRARSMDPSIGGLFQIGETLVGQTSGTVATLNNIEYWGNYSLTSHRVVMSAGYRNNSTNSAGNRWGALSGLAREMTVNLLMVANNADPQDIADIADKAGMSNMPASQAGIAEENFANCFQADWQIYNWGSSANNTGIDGLNTADLDQVTIGGYVDIVHRNQSIGTETTDTAIDWLHDNFRRPGLLAQDMYNFAATRFGQPTLGHAPGADAIFVPNSAIDGFRMDGLMNWSINGQEDYPVDGDNLKLGGNVAFNFMTFRFDGLDFGAGGGLRMYGGLISGSGAITGTGAIDLRNAGKFRVVPGATHTAEYTVTATGGRYEVEGTVGSGVSFDFSGESQGIIYGGGALTIAPGEILILTGQTIKFGFDGQGGQTASLTLAGQTIFVAGNTALPKIRKVRTGRFGVADLGGGVTGQPIAPDVASQVTLGGELVVNVQGLNAGTFTLIEADTLTGDFDTVTITGGSGQVTVDQAAGRVTIAVA